MADALSTEQQVCHKCKNMPAEPDHYCPFQAEINDDKETLCNCCEGCRQECCDDV